MTPATQTLLSCMLTFGVPVLLAIRELIALRRIDRGGSGGCDRPRDPEPPPPPPARGPGAPLPECLLRAARGEPVAAPAGGAGRPRVLEPA